MIEFLLRTYTVHINQLKWMDEETKVNAKQKVSTDNQKLSQELLRIHMIFKDSIALLLITKTLQQSCFGVE